MDEINTIEELGKYVRMPPKSSQKMLLVDPRRIAALEAEVVRLREALEAVEWAESPFLDASEPFCPWCHCVTEGHKPDCMRQAALEPAP